jgi:hypothetical protein
MIFMHTFVVSPLKRRNSGILSMDFSQQVGAEISLITRSLIINLFLPFYRLSVRGLERPASGQQGSGETKNSQSRGKERWICGEVGR